MITFNQSLQLEEVHEDCRKANITPIFTARRENPGNYRPVSLTLISKKIIGQ